MDKKTLIIIGATVVVTLMLANKLQSVPGVNKIPTL